MNMRKIVLVAGSIIAMVLILLWAYDVINNERLLWLLGVLTPVFISIWKELKVRQQEGIIKKFKEDKK